MVKGRREGKMWAMHYMTLSPGSLFCFFDVLKGTQEPRGQRREGWGSSRYKKWRSAGYRWQQLYRVERSRDLGNSKHKKKWGEIQNKRYLLEVQKCTSKKYKKNECRSMTSGARHERCPYTTFTTLQMGVVDPLRSPHSDKSGFGSLKKEDREVVQYVSSTSVFLLF